MPVELEPTDTFPRRHLGVDDRSLAQMLEVLGCASLEELTQKTVPSKIRTGRPLKLPPAVGEHALLEELKAIVEKNFVCRSFIGMGYHGTITPGVIRRNVLENPGWYTQYTPYQAEISQGRLEALLNFQTAISDLTGLEIANASLLDEGTAAAEAMSMAHLIRGGEGANAFFISKDCHPQTIEVVRTRAKPLGWEVICGDHRTFDFSTKVFGVLVQYPATDGAIDDFRPFFERAHQHGALAIIAADPLALTLLTPPGELGADVAVGSTQRFGVPMGYGGPHAAYLSTRTQFARMMAGRIIGVSQDSEGKPALRMALQTREQHIRREKATSNICTAQVLLAVMAGMYAVYHGPKGLQAIARRVHGLTATLAKGLERLGLASRHAHFFDTLRVETTKAKADEIMAAALARQINLRRIDEKSIGITLDETTTVEEVDTLLGVFAGRAAGFTASELAKATDERLPPGLLRKSAYLTHPVFNRYHSETEMLRYIRRLESRDLSLTYSMIPLGSCTMKLNATTEMLPVTWPELAGLHPFAPPAQAAGYKVLFEQLEAFLAEITGFSAISLQPNAGSQGEYTGLLVIRAFHESRGQAKRDVVLVPQSAHGTNPASAVMAGFRVVVVKTDEAGNVDLADLRSRALEHREHLAALMVTYPSTHGVFEEEIKEICSIVHEYGGQVYMDGANMNAQVGLTRPGEIGADVCHLNLHKTFAIPHGGGGPGVGPIGVAPHLAPFLPGHPLVRTGGEKAIGPVCSAPWGSAGVLVISWAYIRMMGAQGLTRATQVAILNANYIAKRLEQHYPTLYKGKQGMVAHECILDTRQLKKTSGVEVEDIAKRLMDYGFHAPTISFPVAGTIMVEPTESESKAELDRFVEAMVAIRKEIQAIEQGSASREDNLLKNAPHTAASVTGEEWKHPYARAQAAFPTEHTRLHKFWPAVGRVNAALGDRHLVCTCPPVQSYEG